MLLDIELQALMTDKPMDAAIDDFASENPILINAIRFTQTGIFMVIQLFGNMYAHVYKK